MNAPLASGTRLGKWTLGEPLGTGSTGIVYRARKGARGPVRALKLLARPPEAGSPPHTRLARQVELCRRLRHPGLARLLEMVTVDGAVALVAELVEGEPLDRLLEGGRPLARHRVVALAAGIARALDRLHGAGLVHRDVKPASVVVSAGDRPRLVDFGLARPAEEETVMSHAGQRKGTLAYMAPEIFLRQPVGPAADLYALGVMLFQMLTGSLPFPVRSAAQIVTAHLTATAPAPSSRVPGLSAWWDRIVSRLLAREPADRYPSAAGLAGDLEMLAGPLAK